MKLSPPPDVPAPTTHFVVVFDGTWQWVQTTREEATSVLKVRIREVSPDPSTQPFNTGFFVTGSGLVAGEDLPGTVVSLVKMYDMRQLPADDERVEKDQFVFVGKLRNSEFERYLERTQQTIPPGAEGVGMEMRSWGIFRFSKKNLRLLSFQLGESAERITCITRIRYRKVNHELPKDAFEYAPPDGVEVQDVTAQVRPSRGTRNEEEDDTDER